MVVAEGRQSPGPGGTPVPRGWIIAFSVLGVILGIVALYTLWAFWPVSGTAQRGTQRVTWLGLHPSVSREYLFFVSIAVAGWLGGLIHSVRSFAWYVGNRSLLWSWVPYNLLLPFVGSLAGTVFYLVLRAGLFSPSTSVQEASPFGFAAVAILAGLFSSQAFEKLRMLAADIFTESLHGDDHVPPNN